MKSYKGLKQQPQNPKAHQHTMQGCVGKLATWLAAAILASQVAAGYSQESVVYFKGPSFTFPIDSSDLEETTLDLNRDGAPDLFFEATYFVCTADVPTSACTAPFYFAAFGSNAVLSRLSQGTVLPFAAHIGQVAPTNATWSKPGQPLTVAAYNFNRFGTSGYHGPLANVGVGYVGVRFYAADGLHYGWIRFRMPFQAEFGPVVVDWAYEARPDTAIIAGFIGSTGESRQFTVHFPELPGTGEPVGTGSLILTGDILRTEISLAGSFSSAGIGGPAPAHSKSHLTSLGPPFVTRTNHTAFFRDISLGRSGVMQLLRGVTYVSVDGGAVVGQISPLN
jgi:hypothetical protein